MEWIGIALQWLFWAILVAFMTPVLLFLRIDERVDYAEDLAFGYDDDDPGEDVDDE